MDISLYLASPPRGNVQVGNCKMPWIVIMTKHNPPSIKLWPHVRPPSDSQQPSLYIIKPYFTAKIQYSHQNGQPLQFPKPKPKRAKRQPRKERPRSNRILIIWHRRKNEYAACLEPFRPYFRAFIFSIPADHTPSPGLREGHWWNQRHQRRSPSSRDTTVLYILPWTYRGYVWYFLAAGSIGSSAEDFLAV